jgi:hypothetical protein
MRAPRRGRPPLGRKAMTDAERQAKRRVRIKHEAKLAKELQTGRPPLFQPPHGYPKAKEQLQKAGHEFWRARREWGHEEGVFVDGAFVSSRDVIMLADMPEAERQQWLDQQRMDWKDFSIGDVVSFMAMMRVSLDELIKHSQAVERSQDHHVCG